MNGSESHDFQDQHVQGAFENFGFFLFHRIPRCSMLISLERLRVKRNYLLPSRRVCGTFTVFERLSREIEIRDEGEAEKVERQALAATKIGPRCVSGLK
jgi:hypothetical protein